MTLNDKLEAFFRARPGIWIDGMEISQTAGSYGWRSRCSDLRLKRGMEIHNRQRRIQIAGRSFTVSEYRFSPAEPRGQATLFEAGA